MLSLIGIILVGIVANFIILILIAGLKEVQRIHNDPNEYRETGAATVVVLMLSGSIIGVILGAFVLMRMIAV